MSSAQASSSKAPSIDDVEKLLSREASAFQREVEVERILKAFKLKSVNLVTCMLVSADGPPFCAVTSIFLNPKSPYEMLDLSETATPEDIKKKYRQLSLCTVRLAPRCSFPSILTVHHLDIP